MLLHRVTRLQAKKHTSNFEKIGGGGGGHVYLNLSFENVIHSGEKFCCITNIEIIYQIVHMVLFKH